MADLSNMTPKKAAKVIRKTLEPYVAAKRVDLLEGVPLKQLGDIARMVHAGGTYRLIRKAAKMSAKGMPARGRPGRTEAFWLGVMVTAACYAESYVGNEPEDRVDTPVKES